MFRNILKFLHMDEEHYAINYRKKSIIAIYLKSKTIKI